MEGSVDGEGWISSQDDYRTTARGRINVCRKSRYFLLKKYNKTSFIADHMKASRRKLQGSEHFRFMDKDIKANPEFTSRQLCGMATEIFRCKSVISTVKMARKVLGWSAQKTLYCALISKVNKEKRMTWR